MSDQKTTGQREWQHPEELVAAVERVKEEDGTVINFISKFRNFKKDSSFYKRKI